MVTWHCEMCGTEVVRSGNKAGRFCSIKCKGEWQRDQKPVDKAWLEQKYLVEGLGTYAIGKIVQRNPKQVWHWLRGYGIPLREREWDISGDTQPYHDMEWLRREYVDEMRSSGEIAAQFGVSDGAILFFLNKFGIESRGMADVRAIKHWGASGEDNPMFGKRGEESSNWKGGATPDRQAFYSSIEWKKASRIVWKRDDGTCQRCGTRKTGKRNGEMHIHHIVSFQVEALRHEPSNLLLLCADCHRWVHSKDNHLDQYISNSAVGEAPCDSLDGLGGKI